MNTKINPVSMSYWETITKIANYNNVDLKVAIKKYYGLTGIPSKECYEAIINTNKLIPCCKVEVTQNINTLNTLNVPYHFAGLKSRISAIDIAKDETGVYHIAYLIENGNGFYFSFEMLKKLE